MPAGDQPSDPRQTITRLLHEAHAGDARRGELYELVFEDLHNRATRCMQGERPGHTLQPTILVNDAFDRLVGKTTPENRRHFYRLAARAMERILIDHEHGRRAIKRGEGMRDELPEEVSVTERLDLIRTHELLQYVAARDELAADVFRSRFFVGWSVSETAALLDLTESQVKDYWAAATSILKRLLAKERRDGS